MLSTPEALLNQALGDATFPYPYPFLHSMLNPEARPSHDPKEASVTHVIKGCTSCKVLQAYEPYTLDLDAGLRAWRGTQFHALLEAHACPGDIIEARFWAKVPGTDRVIHGKPDIIRPHECGEGVFVPATIIDLKTTQSIPMYDNPWGDHVEQLMYYTWLVRHAVRSTYEGVTDAYFPSFKFKSAVIWYMSDSNGDTKFKPLEVRKRTDVPTKPGAKYGTRVEKVPMIWSDEEIEATLIPKVLEYTDAMLAWEAGEGLPPYPPGFDFIKSFEHRFSPVAERCIREHIKTGDI